MHNPTSVLLESNVIPNLGPQIGHLTIGTSSFHNLSSDPWSPVFLFNFLYFNVVRGAKCTHCFTEFEGGWRVPVPF